MSEYVYSFGANTNEHTRGNHNTAYIVYKNVDFARQSTSLLHVERFIHARLINVQVNVFK